MLFKPDLQDQFIINRLQDAYGLDIIHLEFLPLGADWQAAVFRGVTNSGQTYFLKLKKEGINDISLSLPKFLSEQGILQVTPPLETLTGALWAELDSTKLVLYPFIQGRDAVESPLSEAQWVEFGRILKNIHAQHLPPALMEMIPKGNFTPRWREFLRAIIEQVETRIFSDQVERKLKEFLTAKRAEILDLIQYTDRLASLVQARKWDLVPCHADIHAANLLVDEDGGLHILDWDDLILAPKERDLMFIGAGICGVWDKASESALFYQGYGSEADPTLVAYYRCDRIIEDIGLFSEHILEGSGSLSDRELSLYYLKSNFEPGGAINLALKTTYTQNKSNL